MTTSFSLAAFSVPTALVQLLEPWARLYADSKVIATLVVFGHIVALLFAGGLAVTLDRATLRAARDPEARARHLDALAASHRVVIAGLTLSFVTGLMLFTADLETYFVSWIFWTKMLLVVLLLANGFVINKTESALRAGAAPDAGWRRLTRTACASLTLWFAIALAGVALVKAA
jgi:hypothetical protein